jgi:hypothetical protein
MDTNIGNINPAILKALIREVLSEIDFVNGNLCDERHEKLCLTINNMQSQIEKINSKIDKLFLTLMSSAVSIVVALLVLILTKVLK